MDQKIDTNSDLRISIKEDPEEYNNTSNSNAHNHSRDCDHEKKDFHEKHAHSDYCEHPASR